MFASRCDSAFREMRQMGKKKEDGITREKLLTSILKVNELLVHPVSMDEVLSAIVVETQNIFDLHRVAIFMVNKEARLLERKYIAGFSPEEVEKTMSLPLHLDKHPCTETLAANTGQTVYIQDRLNDPRITPIDLKMDRFWKRFSTIAAPLRIERDIIGVFEGDATSRPLRLSRKEIDLFTFFANQAGIIIEKARLQDQNQKKIKQLLLLQEMTRKSSLTFDLGELTANIARSALRLTNAKSSLVFMNQKDEPVFKNVGRAGEVSFKKDFIIAGEGAEGGVAATGQPRIVHDAQKEPGSFDADARSLLAVPIATENDVRGVIGVYSDQISAFSSGDLEILSIMAGHSSVLLQNAALYEQLSMEKNRAENILESSPNGVVTFDGEGVILSVNRRAEQIFGIGRKSMLGKKASEIIGKRIGEAFDRAMEQKDGYGAAEARLAAKSGEDLIVEIITALVKRSGEADAEFLMIFRDITDSRKSEEIMRRMDRLSSLGRLSAGIAHEIRNPLSGIKLNLQMLGKRMKPDPQSMEKINDSLEGIGRINNLVKSILSFARPAAPKFRRDSLHRVLKDTIGILESQIKRRKIELSMELPPDDPEISFDENQVRQVFLNLLLNAGDAMPNGGNIRITGSLDANAASRPALFRLLFSDNGCGIPPEFLPKIFDPFFTTKPEGTGLGLSIVHKILEQHGGLVEVESSVGVGTVFKLTFPVEPVEAEKCISIES